MAVRYIGNSMVDTIDYESEYREGERRFEALGCINCKYCQYASRACDAIFNNEEQYPECPYFKAVNK